MTYEEQLHAKDIQYMKMMRAGMRENTRVKVRVTVLEKNIRDGYFKP